MSDYYSTFENLQGFVEKNIAECPQADPMFFALAFLCGEIEKLKQPNIEAQND